MADGNDSAPQSPFEVKYVQAKPGGKQHPPEWSVPFDIAHRSVEIPNAPSEAIPAYASVGWHVVKSGSKYCPAYRVLESMNVRTPQSPGALDEWQKKTRGQLVVTDRRTGIMHWLGVSFSQMEAMISWFVREPGHEGLVLCRDDKENVWYTEPFQNDLVIWIDSNGAECPAGEGEAHGYRLDLHAHAVMGKGD